MKRRDFLQWTGALAVGGLGVAPASALALSMAADVVSSVPIDVDRDAMRDATAFHAERRYADLPFGKIAYVDRGAGAAALFLHGAPLNGFQWRGAIALLASSQRRCIVPDFMGLGYTEALAAQSLAAPAQMAMLLALLDQLRVAKVDIVASDSGGAVAQLLAAHHPERVRSMLLTNCDVEPDSPPAGVQPAIDMARAGTLADATGQWMADHALARATFGAAVFHAPQRFADASIDYYVQPLVSSPLRKAQYHAFHLALAPNPLAGIEARLKRSTIPVKVVWGDSDTIFARADADYLDRTFARSHGVRHVPDGKLFFPEEYPEIIAEEARRLWRAT